MTCLTFGEFAVNFAGLNVNVLSLAFSQAFITLLSPPCPDVFPFSTTLYPKPSPSPFFPKT